MPPVWARIVTTEYASTLPTTEMSTGTFFNVTLATSTGTVPPAPFLPFPLPLPPFPASVGAEEQADNRIAATRTPSSFEGFKQVDFTTAFSILPAPEPCIGYMA